jgi:4'-phosphopantetheinyl transferase
MAAVDLAPDEVHLWETSLAVHEDEINYDATLLSADEQRYAARFTDVRSKKQFIISRAKLRELLAKYVNEEPRSLLFGMTREGKPYLRTAREFEFNLTHSGDIVLYAVGQSRPVGVDVERVREIPRALELAKRFMSPAEHDRVAAARNSTRDHEFLSLWVKREGSGKAYGVGIWKILESSRSSTPNQLYSEITLDYKCRVIDYNAEYVAAVAALGSDWELVRQGKVRV